MKEENNKISKGFWIGIIVLSLIFISLVTVVLYLYFSAPQKVESRELSGADINFTYTDEENVLTLTNLIALNDQYGIAQNSIDKYFDFSVSIDLEEASRVDYEISVVPDDKNTVPIDYIKVYLEKLNSGSFSSVFDPDFIKLSTKNSSLGTKKGSMVLYSNSLRKSVSDNYRLRAWVDYGSQYVIQPTDIISLKVEVNGKAS